MKNFPNAFVIMICVIVFSWVMTFLVPKGQFERIVDPDTGVTSVVSGSYETIASDQLSLFDLMLAFPEGIIGRADLIVLILLLGSCFYVIEQTGALSQGLIKLGSLFKGKESLALIVLSLAFALAGASIGLHEEIIALTPILLIFNRSLGYDPFVTVISSLGSATLGASFSPFNPFGILIAQALAEVPLISGAGYRMIFLILAFIAWTAYIVYYANRHKTAVVNTQEIPPKMTISSMIILTMLVATFLISGYGLLGLDWGFNELSGLFFVLGIACGLIGKLGINGTGEAYSRGLKEMAYAAVIIGLANSISLILAKGMIIDTLVE
ncbi:MAG: YfcC family protein, partial [Cyclobacteriaceae bacterium]